MPAWHSEENGSVRAKCISNGLNIFINDAFFGGEFELA